MCADRSPPTSALRTSSSRGRGRNLLQRRSPVGLERSGSTMAGILTSEPRPLRSWAARFACSCAARDLGLLGHRCHRRNARHVDRRLAASSPPRPRRCRRTRAASPSSCAGSIGALWYRSWDGAVWSTGRRSRACWPPGQRSPRRARAVSTSRRSTMRATLIHRSSTAPTGATGAISAASSQGELAILAGAPDRIDVFARGRGRCALDDRAHRRDLDRLGQSRRQAHRRPRRCAIFSALHVYARGVDGAIASRIPAPSAWEPG